MSTVALPVHLHGGRSIHKYIYTMMEREHIYGIMCVYKYIAITILHGLSAVVMRLTVLVKGTAVTARGGGIHETCTAAVCLHWLWLLIGRGSGHGSGIE